MNEMSGGDYTPRSQSYAEYESAMRKSRQVLLWLSRAVRKASRDTESLSPQQFYSLVIEERLGVLPLIAAMKIGCRVVNPGSLSYQVLLDSLYSEDESIRDTARYMLGDALEMLFSHLDPELYVEFVDHCAGMLPYFDIEAWLGIEELAAVELLAGGAELQECDKEPFLSDWELSEARLSARCDPLPERPAIS